MNIRTDKAAEFFDPVGKLALWSSANQIGSELTILEHQQSRNRAHAKLGSQFRVLININFGDCNFAIHFRSDFFKRRVNHLARATPFCPKIHNDRLTGLNYIGLEIAGVNFDGGSHEAVP